MFTLAVDHQSKDGIAANFIVAQQAAKRFEFLCENNDEWLCGSAVNASVLDIGHLSFGDREGLRMIVISVCANASTLARVCCRLGTALMGQLDMYFIH